MSKTLYFVRHGQTDWNAERRMQGQLDSQLTELGHQQARINGEAVARLGIDALYASPLKRTRQTARYLTDATGLTPHFDDRLKEWHAGDWSGFLYAEVMEKWTEEWAAWRADMWSYRPPGAENVIDLQTRGGAVLEEILAADATRIAIVSHGFIGRAMIGLLLGLSPDDTLKINTPNEVFFRLNGAPGAWTVDRFEDGNGPRKGFLAEEEKAKAI